MFFSFYRFSLRLEDHPSTRKPAYNTKYYITEFWIKLNYIEAEKVRYILYTVVFCITITKEYSYLYLLSLLLPMFEPV